MSPRNSSLAFLRRGVALTLALGLVACAASRSPGPPANWDVERQLGWWLEAYEATLQDDRPTEEDPESADELADADGDNPQGEASEDGESPSSESDAADQGLDVMEVRRGLARLAQMAPLDVDVLVANGLMAWQQGDRVSAARWLDDALGLEPAHVQAAVARAGVAVREGNLEYARDRLEQAVLLRPDAFRLREALAGVAYFRGDFDEADRLLTLADSLADEPSAARAYHRGLIAEARGEIEQAAEFYDRAIELEPAHVAARNRRLGLRALD